MKQRINQFSRFNPKQIIIAISLFAFVLRLIRLGGHSFWFDEGLELNRALTPWPDLLFLSEGPDPPLFRLVLGLFVRLSRSEFIVRIPSALFGAAAIYLLFHWLSLQKRPRLGLFAASLLAIAPVAIYYSQEVSQYSLVIMLTLLLLIAFENAAQNGGFRDWFFLLLVTTGSLYTYYGLAWLLPVLTVDLAWRTWQQRTRQRFIGFVAYHAGLLTAIGVLYFLFLRVQLQWMGQVALQPFFAGWTIPDIIMRFDDHLFTDFLRFQMVGYTKDMPNGIPAICGLLMLFGTLILWLRHPQLRRLIIIPFAILLTFYLAAGNGYYSFGLRYGLPLLPFSLLLMAVPMWHFATESRGRWPYRAAAVLAGSIIALIFIAFWPNLHLFPNPWQQLPREELRPVVDYLTTEAQPDDMVYVYYGAVPAYKVYQPVPDNPTVYGEWLRHLSPPEKVHAVQTAVGTPPRLWLVFSHISPGEYEELVDGLTATTGIYQLQGEYLAENAAAALLLSVR